MNLARTLRWIFPFMVVLLDCNNAAHGSTDFSKFHKYQPIEELEYNQDIFDNSPPITTGSPANIYELEEKYGTQFRTATHCGGYLEGPAGVINYKVGVNLTDVYEICVWTILVPQKETIQVHLVTDGFYSNFQSIAFRNSSNPTRYQFQSKQVIYGKDRSVHNVTGGSLIQIVFGSYMPTFLNATATGFSLLFEGQGLDTNGSDWHVPIFKVYDIPVDAHAGSIEYIEDSADAAAEGEFVSITIHPEKNKMTALTVDNVVVSGRGNCPWNTVYWYDTLRITEVGRGTDSTILFQDCKNTWYNTTVYSSYPLSVSFYSFTGYRQGFGISWTML